MINLKKLSCLTPKIYDKRLSAELFTTIKCCKNPSRISMPIPYLGSGKEDIAYMYEGTISYLNTYLREYSAKI